MTFLSALTLILVVAKILGWVTFSWLLVFLPAAIRILIGVGLICLMVVAAILKD